MVDKCANEKCSQVFDYRRGRLYCCRIQTANGDLLTNNHGLIHYWLCETCAKTYTFEEPAAPDMAITPNSPSTSGRRAWANS